MKILNKNDKWYLIVLRAEQKVREPARVEHA